MNSAAFDTTLLQTIDTRKSAIKQSTNYGLLIAFFIISLWAGSFVTLLSVDLARLSVWLILPAILWQIFLYTGLFITAHDAMHGSVCSNPKINHFIGSLAVTLYGLFSYKELLKKHWLHHRYPASDRDPDFHDGQHTHPVRWYLYFMSRYWNWQQFTGLAVAYCFAGMILHISLVNLILFWIIPSILSSIQLFYFGTFLTHQEPAEGFKNSHHTQTNPLPVFWSFVTCYHFGYHEEHHEYPHVSWWQLPKLISLHKRPA